MSQWGRVVMRDPPWGLEGWWIHGRKDISKRQMIRRSHLAALAAAFVTSACGAAESLPQRLRVQVVAAHPHDPSAFTQGLIIDGEGRLLESTGRYGVSDVRVVDIATGAVLDRTPIAADLFGEGLARVGDRLVQLTWQERKALVFDAATLDLLPITFAYDTEGWALCYDAGRLVMSDGSSTLTFRAPDTFDRLGAALVTLGGAPLDE